MKIHDCSFTSYLAVSILYENSLRKFNILEKGACNICILLLKIYIETCIKYIVVVVIIILSVSIVVTVPLANNCIGHVSRKENFAKKALKAVMAINMVSQARYFIISLLDCSITYLATS